MNNLIKSKTLASCGLLLAITVSWAQFHGTSSEPDRMSLVPAGGWIKTEKCASRIALTLLEEMKWPMANLPKGNPSIKKLDGLWTVRWQPANHEAGVAPTIVELDARTAAVVYFYQGNE